MRQRNNPRIRLSTAAVRCRSTFTYHADGQLASASCDGIGRAGAETGAAMLDYTGNEMTISFVTK